MVRITVFRRLTVGSLAITCACLPLYVVRWQYGPLPSTLLETLIGITLALYLALLWVEKRLPAARTPFDIPIALFLIAGLIGIFVAPNYFKAAGIYRAYFIEAAAIYYVAVDVLREPEDIRVWLGAMAGGAAIYSISETVLFGWVFLHHALVLGAAPSFLNTTPNADAMYLEPALAFAAAFVAFPSARRERLVAAVVLALSLVAIVLTLSRASYLAIAVLAVVFVLSLQSGRVRGWAIVAIGVIAAAVLEVPFVNQRIGTLALSASLRSSIYSQALRLLSERPIFGAGISGFPVRVAPFRPSSQVVEIYPHDIWLTTWSEVGLLGVIAFGVILFGVIWTSISTLPKATGVYRALLWGSLASFVLYLIHGFFDSVFWKNDLSVEFFLVVALNAISLRAVRRGQSCAGGSDVPWRPNVRSPSTSEVVNPQAPTPDRARP